jgi:hypothetical protein
MELKQVLAGIWKRLIDPWFLAGVIGGLALLTLVGLLLPQAPVPRQQTAQFSRWLARVRPRLGAATDPLATLGLLTVRYSGWQRAALALLALVMSVRAVEIYRRQAQLSLFALLKQSLLCLACILLLIGWGLNVSRGWIKSSVIAWPETTVSLSSREISFKTPAGIPRLTFRGYGLYLVRTGIGMGVSVRAEEGEAPIELLTSARGEPQEELQLILSEQSPDAYFALTKPGYIFRATLQAIPPTPQIQVQVYRSGGEALLTETVLQGSGTIFTDDLEIHLQLTPLPQLRAIYNPGAPLTTLGWVGLVIATILREPGWRFGPPTSETDAEEQITESEVKSDA